MIKNCVVASIGLNLDGLGIIISLLNKCLIYNAIIITDLWVSDCVFKLGFGH